MSKLKSVGSELYYTLYNDKGEIVGDIDKTMLSAVEQDVDASVHVTLPCGFRMRFWNLTLTDEQYIYAANYFKDENEIAKKD